MSESDIEKSTVIKPFGLFECVFMPFGLCNSSTTFQRFIDNIFMDVGCIFIYINDILVLPESKEHHDKDHRKVLSNLQENNLPIFGDKCQFYKDSTDFLGYNVSTEEPTDSKSLCRFLGMVNFYRKLIPHAAEVLLPLRPSKIIQQLKY